MNKLLILFIISSVYISCSTPKPQAHDDNNFCQTVVSRIDIKDCLKTLNNISELYYGQCYQEVIKYGTFIRETYRQKNYSITKELSEIFLPEGATTEYVLESYERAYLSFLLGASYFNLGQENEAMVELSRLNNETNAIIYNFGEDPINLILQGVMWENVTKPLFSSRPFWERYLKLKSADKSLKPFIKEKLKSIDLKAMQDKWAVYALGEFPELDWSMTLKNSKTGYFRVKPKEPFLENCYSKTGMLINADSWFNKIAMRHSHKYHPLVNAKSWIRLPIGIIYTVTTFVAGAGLAVGGCALDIAASANDHGSGGVLCELSIRGGVLLMSQTDDVAKYILQPDLRHWEKIPASFLFTNAPSLKEEECYNKNIASLSNNLRPLVLIKK